MITVGKLRYFWAKAFTFILIFGSTVISIPLAHAAAPTITSLSIAYGAKTGGATTVIAGTNLIGTTGVTVGGIAAAINTISDLSVSITIPASATTGAKNVVLTNADGTSTLVNAFTYTDSAVSCGTSGSFYITGTAVVAAEKCVGTVSVPDGVATINACTFGNAVGGNCGTLSGNAVTAVILPASTRTIAGYSFLGATTMTSITIPEGVTTIGNSAFYASGKHSVNIPTTVTNIDAAFYRSNVSQVTFSTPTSLTSIGTSTFRATPNLTSIIVPEGVTSLAAIAFGDIVNPASSLKWISLPSTLNSVATTGNTTFQYLPLTCVVNPGNTSFINNLTFPNSPTIVTDFANCPAPTFNSLSPSSGTTQGGTSTSFSGTNLLTVYSVTIGGAYATITARTATAITVTIPAGTEGSKDVVISTYGHTVTSTGAFTYLPLPTVTSLSVTSGPISGGTVTIITGTNLSSISSVLLGGTAATRGSNTSTSISITTPSNSVGAKDLVITNLNGTITISGAFTYVEQVDSFSIFALPGSVTSAYYRTPITITATVAYSSKITFKVSNLKIPGCSSVRTTVISPFTASCKWSPSRRGTVVLTATSNALTAGITSGIAIPIVANVGNRQQNR